MWKYIITEGASIKSDVHIKSDDAIKITIGEVDNTLFTSTPDEIYLLSEEDRKILDEIGEIEVTYNRPITIKVVKYTTN